MTTISLPGIFSAKLAMPLVLLTPYVFVLHYGISALELMVLAFAGLILIPSLSKNDLVLPRFLLIFYALFTLGYIGALINGIEWNVPLGLWNLNFFYKLVLGMSAFIIGMRFHGDISRIFQSRLMLAAVIALGGIAIIYPFLPYATKVQYIGVFYPPGSGFEQYLTSRRLPGLGLNANIYAFIVFGYFLLSFRAFLDKKITALIPLICTLVILVLSSKLVIALTLASCAALIFDRSFRFSIPQRGSNLRLRIGKRGFFVGSALASALVLLILFATTTTAGKQLVDSYATVQRFEAALAERSYGEKPVGLALRFTYWKKGLERARLAPILGIAKDPFRRLAGSLVGFYNPHNEFLRMWLLYGFAGMCAWAYLLVYMYLRNARYRTGIEWRLFYAALALFMVFDGGLDDPRVTASIFLLFGLNWSVLKQRAARRDDQTSAAQTANA